MDPNSGRERRVVDGGKGVQKRGSGLGTGGPVGRSDGYAGRTSSGSSGGSRPQNTQRRPQNDNRNTPRRSSGGRGGMGMIGIILVVIVVIVIVASQSCSGSSASSGSYSGQSTGGYGQSTGSGQSGTGSYSGQSAGGSYSGQSTSPYGQYSGSISNGFASSDYGDLFGMLSGYSGSNNVSSGWSSAQNTSKLNREVAPEARAKRTRILGGGQDRITIMVYMCGTDLESKSGMASRDLQEMCSATLSDNVDILVYTGGCRQWKIQGISNSVNQIYRVSSGGLERLISDAGNKVMTDPATLTEFIQWCAQNYPANRNELIFWDHGSGSLSGYGYDEKNQRAGSMSLAGINRALADAGVTFDFIGFDACLMATLETAFVTSNYADYLIASEETEPGIGWYYTDWLTSLSADPAQATIDTGKNIVDSFVEKCAVSCQGQKATLSVVDLAELEQTVPSKLSAFSEDTQGMIRGDNYKQVSNARADTREFAASSRIDQIDLVDFAGNIGTQAAAELSDVLLSAVKYNRTSSNMTNAYGLSIYFPYNRTSKLDSMTSIYEEIGMDEEYAACIRSFAGLETCGQISAGGASSPLDSLFGTGMSGMTSGSDALSALFSAYLSGGSSFSGIDRDSTGYLDGFDISAAAEYIAANQFDPSGLIWYPDGSGQYLMALPDEEWDKIQRLQINMFYDDGEGFIDLGLDNVYQFTDNGRLIGENTGYWISIDKQPVAYYYETTIIDGGQKTITGRVPAYLDGERVNLILVFDNDHPSGYIAGAVYVYVNGETETVAKSITEIEDGAEIDFICDYYAYDGTFIDNYILGAEPTIYHADIEIGDTYVGEDTQITYLLTDLYNNEYWTPVLPQ